MPPIADLMSRDRYKKNRSYLHVADNTMKDNPGNTENKLYKVAPVIDHVKQNCNKIEPEQYQSMDEQIVPAKTRFSGIRQYSPKKPTKWGFKNFVLSGSNGIMHDFFFYTGATGNEKCNGPYVVKRLVESLPKNENYRLFFDNWFCTCKEFLKRMGILSAAIFRED